MANGLDGVVAAETVLSHTDRTGGMVWVRGYDLPALAANHGFEGTVALLWEGFAGEGLTRAGTIAAFGAARGAAFADLPAWLPQTRGRTLFEGMRIAIAAAPDSANATSLVAAFAVAVPALARQAAGLPPVAPDPLLTTAADLLRMLHGTEPDGAKVAALDTYFTVMAESGLSASSFAARVVASTRATRRRLCWRRGAHLPAPCMAVRPARPWTCWTKPNARPISMRGQKPGCGRGSG